MTPTTAYKMMTRAIPRHSICHKKYSIWGLPSCLDLPTCVVPANLSFASFKTLAYQGSQRPVPVHIMCKGSNLNGSDIKVSCKEYHTLQSVHKASPLKVNMCKRSKSTLQGSIDKYKGVHVNLEEELHNGSSPEMFNSLLQESLQMLKKSGVTAVWWKLSMAQGEVLAVAAKHGFLFHNAEENHAMLYKWLVEDMPCMLPRFATHQVGVAGETARREVFEETGVKSEFRGILTLRQQHDQPGAFGRSDIYMVCHMTPLTYDLHPCDNEIEACTWMNIHELAKTVKTSAITLRIIQLVQKGLEEGFSEVDMVGQEYRSIYKGLKYVLYHKHLDEELETYVHSIADSGK